jgi:hypothetical protein
MGDNFRDAVFGFVFGSVSFGLGLFLTLVGAILCGNGVAALYRLLKQ